VSRNFTPQFEAERLLEECKKYSQSQVVTNKPETVPFGISSSATGAAALNQFLGGGLNAGAMTKAVDSALYRQKAASA